MPRKDILDVMLTRPSGLFDTKLFNEETLREDVVEIRRLYRGEGFLDAEVVLEDLRFSDDKAKTQAEFARFSAKDAAVYPEFDAYLQESLKHVRKLLFETPVDPTKASWRDLKENAQFLWRYRNVGGQFYRILDLMKKMRDESGTTFVFSTHDPKIVETAEVILTLEDGRLVGNEAKRHG